MKATITLNPSASTTFVRMIIFRVLKPASTLPVVSDVLATVFVQSPLNMSNSRSFRILTDKLLKLDVNGEQTRTVNLFQKVNDHIKFDTSGASAQANAEEGHIFLLLLSDQATNTPSVAWYNRLRFYDN